MPNQSTNIVKLNVDFQTRRVKYFLGGLFSFVGGFVGFRFSGVEYEIVSKKIVSELEVSQKLFTFTL